MSQVHPSESDREAVLNQLIAPEVNHDAFAEAIRNLARSAQINTVLKIGSSSGEGRTLAWVEGLRQNPSKPKLYCIEVSKVRCEALKKRWEPEGFVEFSFGSSVGADAFPTEQVVAEFHRDVKGPLQQYPLEEVLGWLRADTDYLKQEGVPTNCIREIKRAKGIKHFDAVLIDGSEFTGEAELDEVYGAEFILLDDTQTYKCHAAHRKLLHDPGYELIAEGPNLRNGFSIFRRRRRTLMDPLPEDAPVHYFTIVLNGEPFIRHHIEVFKQLPFRWHWHVVEGAATLTHDTSASKATGGALVDEHHRGGLSTDGTSEYLDALCREFPGQVTVYRKPGEVLWDGKIEMVAEPVKHIFEDAVLWEIDADELWTVEQLEKGRRMFLDNPDKTAAYFWCHYFVGERLLLATRYGYAQNPQQEWLRAWSFRPGMKWQTHEPPVLAERCADGSWKDIAQGRIFTHAETEAFGLVFHHMAYVTEQQLAFKERYYGLPGAVDAWAALQRRKDFPLRLGEAFAWVTDGTMVNTAETLGVSPIASRKDTSGEWSFISRDLPSTASAKPAMKTVVVDGVFFQLSNSGIARVWEEVLKIWGATSFGSKVWLLDREGTAPVIAGINYRRIKRSDETQRDMDAQMLQGMCEELNAGVFISTYYTFPDFTRTVSMIYDMIPELMRAREGAWQWTEKTLSILQASQVVCASYSTANDLLRFHPEVDRERVTVTSLAPAPGFLPSQAEEETDFRHRHGLDKDYLLVVGERIGLHLNTQGYKNVALAFKAWALLPADERASLMIVCAGGRPALEEELRVLAPGAEVRLIRFSDEDLRLAYSGAVALVYPSLYEGFGMPVVEAMASGCPVITCARGSLKEVAGDAAWMVDPWDAQQTADAIATLRYDGQVRSDLIERGLVQAKKFSFPRMASQLAAVLDRVAGEPLPKDHDRQARVWEFVRRWQSAEVRLGMGEQERRVLATQVAELQKLSKKQTHETNKISEQLKKAQKLLKKADKQLREEVEKRRRPLRHLWRKLWGKK